MKSSIRFYNDDGHLTGRITVIDDAGIPVYQKTVTVLPDVKAEDIRLKQAIAVEEAKAEIVRQENLKATKAALDAKADELTAAFISDVDEKDLPDPTTVTIVSPPEP